MSTAVENFPALVLNADFRPLSYFPLSLWSWQNSIKAVFLSRVNVVSEYDRAIHSPSTEIKLQSNELDDARWFDRYELRNPGAADSQQGRLFIGFAGAELLGLLSFVIAALLIFQ